MELSDAKPESPPELNFDALLYIFRHLDGDDLAACAMVCREWRAAADYLRRKLRFLRMSFGGTLVSESRILKYHKGSPPLMTNPRQPGYYKASPEVFRSLTKGMDAQKIVKFAVTLNTDPARAIAIDHMSSVNLKTSEFVQKVALRTGQLEIQIELEKYASEHVFKQCLEPAVMSGKLSLVRYCLDRYEKFNLINVEMRHIVDNGTPAIYEELLLHNKILVTPNEMTDPPDSITRAHARDALVRGNLKLYRYLLCKLKNLRIDIDESVIVDLCYNLFCLKVQKEILEPEGWTLERILEIWTRLEISIWTDRKRINKNLRKLLRALPSCHMDKYQLTNLLVDLNADDCIKKFDLFENLKAPQIVRKIFRSNNLEIFKMMLDQFGDDDPIEGVMPPFNCANSEMLKYYIQKKGCTAYLKEFVCGSGGYPTNNIFGVLLEFGDVKPYEFYKYRPSSTHMESLYRRGLVTDADLEKAHEELIKSSDSDFVPSIKFARTMPKSYINKKITLAQSLDDLKFGGSYMSFLQNLSPDKITLHNRKKIKEFLIKAVKRNEIQGWYSLFMLNPWMR